MNGELEIEPGPAPAVELEIEPIDDERPAIEPEVVKPGPEPQVDEQAIARQATDLVSVARALKIVDPASFERAGAMLQQLKDQQRRIEDFFKPDVDRAHAAWKGLCDKRAGYLDPLKAAITILSDGYASFAKEAQRKADMERRRLEREAQEREQARLRELAEAEAAAAKQLTEEAEKASSRDEAIELEQRAAESTAHAEQLNLAAATVPAPVLHVAPSVTPPKGTSVRQHWTWELVDKRALIAAVAAGTVSIEAIDVNSAYLTARAKADKGTASIPGVRFYDAGSVAVRRR